MPLTDPPAVQFRGDPTWHPTEWDPSPPPNLQSDGEVVSGSVQYLHWTVALDDEPARGYRLRVSAGIDTDGAVPVYDGQVRAKVVLPDSSETIVGPAGRVWVTS